MAAILIKLGNRDDNYSENGEIYGILNHDWKTISDEEITSLINKIKIYQKKKKNGQLKSSKDLAKEKIDSNNFKKEVDESQSKRSINKYYEIFKNKGAIMACMMLASDCEITTEEAGMRLQKIVREIESDNHNSIEEDENF